MKVAVGVGGCSSTLTLRTPVRLTLHAAIEACHVLYSIDDMKKPASVDSVVRQEPPYLIHVLPSHDQQRKSIKPLNSKIHDSTTQF